MHKKSTKQHNKNWQDLKDLENTLTQENTILRRQNTELNKKLHAQIGEQFTAQIAFEKKEQVMRAENQQLKAQIESLNRQILKGAQEKDPDDIEDYQASYLEMMQKYKQKAVEAKDLIVQLETFKQELKTLDEENQMLKKSNNSLDTENRELTKSCQEFAAIIQQLEHKHQKTMAEFKLLTEEISQKDAECRKCKEQYGECKKKLKDEKKKFQDLAQRLNAYEEGERKNNESLIAQLKQQKQQLQQKLMCLSTKIQFLQLNLSQKEEYIRNCEEEFQSKQHAFSAKELKITKLAEKAEEECRRLKMEIELQKNRYEQEAEQDKERRDEEILKMKKKLAEEMITLMKGKDPEKCQKTLNSYISGMRPCHSQANFTNNGLSNFFPQKQPQILSLERVKLENQIMGLESQISTCRKKIQSLSLENNHFNSQVQQLQAEVISKEAVIRELEGEIRKQKEAKDKEFHKLNNQKNALRQKETELLEIKRDRAQYEEAIALKVEYYENKYRDLSNTLERKESMVDKLKNHRFELDQKCKIMESKLLKSKQDAENLRRARNDCQRKDQLVREYKARQERAEEETKRLRGEIEALRKQKNKVEKALQNKEYQLSSIRAKYEKQADDFQERLAEQSKTQHTAKELKSNYQQRLKQLKKERENYNNIILSVKACLDQHIQRIKERKLNQRGSASHWEAASLLGLRQAQLGQFLNPDTRGEMKRIWEEGRYSQYLLMGINTLIKHNS